MMLRTLLIAAAFTCVTASAQSPGFHRWEAGLHLSNLDLSTISENALGGGGHVSYFLTPHIAVEAEISRYFEDPSHNFGHTEFVAGPRVGGWIGPLGLFAKARPGILVVGGNTAVRNPGRENNFVLNLGGAVLLGRGRVGMRIDAGDTVIAWGTTPFNTGLPRAIVRNHRELSIGFVVRFR